jgi:TPR repeat protein
MRIPSLKRANLYALCLLLLAFAVPAAAQEGMPELNFKRETIDGKRVALVIGNTAYKADSGWQELPNAANDATHIAKVLSDPGRGAARFDVQLVTNGTRQQIWDAIVAFSEKSEKADVAVIYYSGHGFEHERKNFIVPSDAPGRVDARKIELHYIDMEQVVDSAPSRGFSMFFLDACRTDGPVLLGNDGSKSSDSAGMFGAIEAPQSIVFYATARGTKAYDQAPPGSKLSPFAQALAKGMSQPGLDFASIIPAVTDYVLRVTQDKPQPQQPLLQGSWTRAFYFLPENAVGGASKSEAAAKGLSEQPAPQPSSGPQPRKIELSYETMSIVDEPTLVARILEKHKPSELIAAAEGGDPVALYLLGYMYSYGFGIGQDLGEARKWLERAAATGHPAGQLEYGYFLAHQSNRPGERKSALELYRKAAAQGFTKAKTHLAATLLAGDMGETNRPEAMRLLNEAASAGHPNALFMLAQLGQKANSVAALRKLADAGNLDGDHWLCEIAIRDGDHQAAADRCLKAARGGFSDARAHVASLYANGQGLPRSESDARYWARLARSQLDLRPDLKARVAALAQ